VNASTLSDEDLLARVARGDTSALEALFDRYAPSIKGLGRKILGDDAGLDDLVQETFWRMWIRAGTYEPKRGRVASWLFGIAHHLAIDDLRRRRSRPDPVELDPVEAYPDLGADVAQAAQSSMESKLVREAFDALPLDQRRVLEMAYFEGLTRREIARALGVPLGTVHTRARLGLMKLRAELRARGYEG
jgi:RNA polymerase sigma-70 factor (ECF subfamily)